MEEGNSQESLIEARERSESDEAQKPVEDRPGRRKCCQFSPQSLVCISHAFSAWGDRMWHFAIGLYLVELTPESLRLTAIYQLVSTLSIIIFGPLVGDWVDANPRLKVAQVSLIIQNVAVIICGVLLIIMLELAKDIPHAYFVVLEALVIIVGSIADLSSVGTKIAVEKDWVVVLAGSDKKLLASTNAILRRIDLCCKILAPILVGQIMTFISKLAGVIFLVGWNVLSVFLEYYLLWNVFQSVTALSQKVLSTRQDEDSENGSSVDHNQEEMQGAVENEDGDAESIVPAVRVRGQRPRKSGIFSRIMPKRIQTFRSGFRIYFAQTVARPGLALALLYFTVISFGAITTGYAYTQCLTESVLSLIRGAGSLFGVLATFTFPRLRNAVGLVRSGLFSMSLQFSCLLFCAASVFAPGSPFFLLPRNSIPIPFTQYCPSSQSSVTVSCSASSLVASATTPMLPRWQKSQGLSNTSIAVAQPSSSQIFTGISSVHANSTVPSAITPGSRNGSLTPSMIFPTKTREASGNSSVSAPLQNCSSNTEAPTGKYTFSHISIGLLLAGIVTSRLGLWMSDLTISQLFQEAVPEQERGIVAGMQNSFNSILSLLMYFLVIALPKPEQFGLLVLMSVSAVGCGGLLYASFTYKLRGHLFHADKFKKCLGYAPPERLLVSADDNDFEDDEEEEAMITGRLSTRNENFKL